MSSTVGGTKMKNDSMDLKINQSFHVSKLKYNEKNNNKEQNKNLKGVAYS